MKSSCLIQMEPENLKNGSEGVAGENISNLAFKNGNGSSLPVRNTPLWDNHTETENFLTFKNAKFPNSNFSQPLRLVEGWGCTLCNLLRPQKLLKMVKFLLKIL